MGTQEFLEICKKIIVEHYNKNHFIKVKEEDIYNVWNCKTLQNNKGLFSTTVVNDETYYEVTYNGDKNELYLDYYTKEENVLISYKPKTTIK